MSMRLTPEESNDLLEVADGIVKGGATAVCAYGSKVAGYARGDSDYDIIVVAKKFNGGIRYLYRDTPLKTSALVITERLLESDALRASLGEFVSGRLLNVYEPLRNGELIRKAEVESKKRVITEAIWEVSSEYGEFSQDLIIPFDYFLFDKLHKRALIYPPALYSYVKTYTCALAGENREFTRRGFVEAAQELNEGGGFLRMEDTGIKLVGEKLRSRAFVKLLSLFNLTTRGVRQYAVHGYAGRVGLTVFKEEALSKVKRMQEKVEPPRELEEPRSLLRIEEGVALTTTTEMIRALADSQGFEEYTHTEKSLGEIYSTARVVTLRGGREVRYVFKHFADLRSMKWAILNVWSLSRKFSMSPQARMHREYTASQKLRDGIVSTPRVLGAVLDERILVKEFIEGQRLSDLVEAILKGRTEETIQVRGYGSALAWIHGKGFALGDSKANNIIIAGDGVFYFTDLEQAVEGGDQCWDVAEFLYYAGKLSFKEAGIRRVADAFLDGYRERSGTENIRKAMAQKYAAPFRPVTTLPVLKIIRESIEVHSK